MGVVDVEINYIQILINKWTADGIYALPKREKRIPCPSCQIGSLIERTGRFGAFWGCSSYPSCSFTKNA